MAYFTHGFGGGFQVGFVVAVGVFADVFEHKGELFGGAVKKADAAVFELAGVFGVENQIPFVGGQLVCAEGFGDEFFVDGQSVNAPEIGDGVFVARVYLRHQFEQLGVDVVVVGDLAFVDFLIRARFDLPSDVGDGWGDEVKA